jgi:hypothetical protein
VKVAISLLVVAIGAMLTWAVSGEVAGVEYHTVGIAVLAVGLGALLVSLGLSFAKEG